MTNHLKRAKRQQDRANSYIDLDRDDTKLFTGLARTEALITIAEAMETMNENRSNTPTVKRLITIRLQALRVRLNRELDGGIATAECTPAAVLYDVAQALGVSTLSVLGDEALVALTGGEE